MCAVVAGLWIPVISQGTSVAPLAYCLQKQIPGTPAFCGKLWPGLALCKLAEHSAPDRHFQSPASLSLGFLPSLFTLPPKSSFPWIPLLLSLCTPSCLLWCFKRSSVPMFSKSLLLWDQLHWRNMWISEADRRRSACWLWVHS